MDHLKLALINAGVRALTGSLVEFRRSLSGEIYSAATEDRQPPIRDTSVPGLEPLAIGIPAANPNAAPSSTTTPDAPTSAARSTRPPPGRTGFDFDAAVRRANDGHSASSYGDILLPRPTARASYRGREHTVVSLFCRAWVVARILVPHLGWFAEGIPTWTNTCFGDVRWRVDYRDGRYVPVLMGKEAPVPLPFIPSWRKALSLSSRHRSWVVSQHARIAEGGPHLAMPPTYGHVRSALAIHRVITAKSREPIVEAYMIAGDVEDGKPTAADSISLVSRVVLSYRDAIMLAVNALVWAIAILPDGSHRIARVLPRGLAPTSTESPDLPAYTIAMSCVGLDLLLQVRIPA